MANKPTFHILLCLIEVWKPQSGKSVKYEASGGNATTYITEVSSIEIEDTYKKPVTKAKVTFPLGTVIKKTLTVLQEEAGDRSVNDFLSKLTQSAEVDKGIVNVVKSDSRIASNSDFAVGNRIKIRLGYTTDPKIASYAQPNKEGKSIVNNSTMMSEYKSCLHLMFDGYISKVNVDAPIVLECENLGYIFKRISCPKNIRGTAKTTVNSLFDSPYNLLEGTGIELYPQTKRLKINVAGADISDDLTVADILMAWADAKLFSFIKYDIDANGNEKPYLAIGSSYFSNLGSKNKTFESVYDILSEQNNIPEIEFDYHVANNGLESIIATKEFMVVNASGFDKDGKGFKLSLRANPDYPHKSKEKWDIFNETKLTKKQRKAGMKPMSGTESRVKLEKETVIPYVSRTIPITRDQLKDEAIAYYEAYQPNGVQGSLTLFGDLHLKAGEKVRLNDKIHSNKNGVYLIDEITTTFGTSGYRQTIRLPYCIKRDNDESKK